MPILKHGRCIRALRTHDGEGRLPTKGACMTVEEVAQALGYSRQRIQQIEASALKKLRLNRVIRELAGK